MVDIQEYKNRTIKDIEELVKSAGILNAELSDKVREITSQIPNLKEWSERMITWRTAIYDSQSVEAIDIIYSEMTQLIRSIMNEQHEKERQEIKKEGDWWKKHYSKVSESEKQNREWWEKYRAGELDWQKDSKKREEENKKKFEESEKIRMKEIRKNLLLILKWN